MFRATITDVAARAGANRATDSHTIRGKGPVSVNAVPVILGAMVKSQMLEVVLQSKPFTGTADRTNLHESNFHLLDCLMIAFFVAVFILAIGAYLIVGFGKFGTFI